MGSRTNRSDAARLCGLSIPATGRVRLDVPRAWASLHGAKLRSFPPTASCSEAPKMISRKYSLPLIVLASSIYSAILCYRWVFTGTPAANTFGRAWQYFVSWSDFGFARRELIVTALTESGLNRLTDGV